MQSAFLNPNLCCLQAGRYRHWTHRAEIAGVVCLLMLENIQFAAEYAGCTLSPALPCLAASEIERQQTSQLVATYHRRLRLERRMRSLRSLISLWPVVLGVLLGVYASTLRDLAANSSAPWAVTLLFPFSALVSERGLHFSSDTARALAQFLLYAQFPLEGLMARIVLKHRVGLFKVFGRVTVLHGFAVLYLVLASGALSHFLAN
jgi:hypothetical protein